MNHEPVYIVDGARTPFLKARNRPGPFAASDLATAAGRALLLRQPFEPTELDEVILGCAAPSADEVNIGRVAALRMGCGQKVPGWTVMRNCASGMQSLDSAITNIRAGPLEPGARRRRRRAVARAAALLRRDGRSGCRSGTPAQEPRPKARGAAREVPAGVPRAGDRAHEGPHRPDRRAADGPDRGEPRLPLRHHARGDGRVRGAQPRSACSRAQKPPATSPGEVVPLYAPAARSTQHDDGVREDSTVENLAKLKPFFDRKYGNVTAGNSSQVTDGAAWLRARVRARRSKQHDLEPLGRIVDSQWAGLDPAQMGLGPVHAATPILRAPRPRARRPRRVGDQRSVRGAGARVPARVGERRVLPHRARPPQRARPARPGEAQRRRRRDRARPSGRRVRRAHRAAPAERARAHRRQARHGGDLHRRRPGRRDAGRACRMETDDPADALLDKDAACSTGRSSATPTASPG